MYIFEAIYNNDSTITVKSNTFWSCKVEGNFMLSAYDGLANEEGVDIDIIVPNEIEIIEGTVTFTYGDDRCKYPEIYVYQINNCILETTPGFIESNGRKEIYFPNKNEGDTISIKVKTAYNSLTSWTYEKIGTNSNVFTNDSEMFIVVGSEQGEIKISNQYCDDSIYIVMCTSEGYVCEYTLYTDATIVDWYFGSTKYTSTRVFRGMAKCSRTFYDGEQMQYVTAKPKKGDHVYEDVIIACGESKESYCQTTIITEGEYSCHDGGTITFIIDKCDDGPTCEEKVEYQYGVGSLTLGACDTEGNARIPYTSTTTYIDCATKTSTGNKTVHVTGFTKNEGDPIRNRSYTFTSDGVQYTILYNQGGHCTPPPTPVSTSITWNNATVTAGKCDISKTVTIAGTKVTVYSDGSETRTSTSTTQTYSIGKNETSSPKVYTFTYNGATIIINQEAGPCTTPPPTPTENYFAITSRANNNVIKLIAPDANSSVTVSVSTDNGANWNTFESTTEGITVATLNNGQTALFKGSNETMKRNRFSSTGQFDVSGDILTLTNGNMAASGFRELFSGTSVVSAEHLVLSADTLANNCYSNMFNRCTSLTTAPQLSATTLASYCYNEMFYRCTSLTTAPQLSATTLAEGCYQYMFYNCRSLTTAPDLPATTLASICYLGMFYGCRSLTEAPELPATELMHGCYLSMFSSCRSLTMAPELPADTLASQCYESMFSDCTSLIDAPVLSATTLTRYCYSGMFRNCTSLKNAPELPATTLTSYCYSYMFRDCASLIVAPVLPATTLASDCYSHMFSGCTSLNSITCLATSISADDCTENWVSDVASTGTFNKAQGMCDWSIGVDGIPEGWDVSPDDCGGGEPEYCEPIMDGDTGTPSIKLKWVGIDTNGTFYTDYLNTKDKWIYASGSLSMIAHVELNNSGGIGAAGQTLCSISIVERYCAIVMRTTDYDTWPGGTTYNDSPTNTGSVYTLNDSTVKQTFNLYSRTDEDNQLLLRDYMVSKAIRIPYSGYKGKTQFYCYPYTFSSSMFAVEQSVSYLTRDEEHSVISGKNAVNGSLSENGFTMHYENTNNSSLEYELSYEIAPNTTCSYKEHIVKLGRGVQEGKNYSGSTTEGGASVAAIHFLQEYKTKNRVYYGNGFTQKKYDDNYNQTSSDLYQYHMFFETCSSHVLVEDEKTFGVASYVAYPLTDDFEYDVSMEMGEMVIEKDNYMWGETPMRIVKSGAYYRVKFTKKQ